MDISKFKDIVKKLSFISDYSSLVLPVIILIVTLVILVLTPLLIGGKLEARLEKESIAVGRKVQSLSQNAVARNQWQVEKSYQDGYSEDVNQISLLAVQTTQRDLLSYKIFPAPTSTSAFIFDEFGRQFRSNMDALLSRVNARDCPTEVELQRTLNASSGRSYRGRSNSAEATSTILDVLCREKAESARFYANPAEFSVYEFWGKKSDEKNTRRTASERYVYTGMEESVQACWYSQLAYWIIEDVVNTINEINKNSNSVLTSPVKRLLSVNFSTGAASYSTRGRRSVRSGDDKPYYILSASEGLATPLTARACNEDVDIIHFGVSVAVSTDAVLEFMKELCSAREHKFRGFNGAQQERTFEHNQITILQSSVLPVDRQNAAHAQYRYGEDAVVELVLVCEYILNKKGYDEIKPESIEKLFQVVEDEY